MVIDSTYILKNLLIITSRIVKFLRYIYFKSQLFSCVSFTYIQGGSNMTGTNCDLFTHKSSRSYLNHLVFCFLCFV
jgi:hypothetical protein